jgi:hypothetical protein
LAAAVHLILKVGHPLFLPLLVQVVVVETLFQVVLEVLEDQVLVEVIQVEQEEQVTPQQLHPLKVTTVEMLVSQL